MARKRISKEDDPFYIEQDEETGELFSKETINSMLDMGSEEPRYQDKLVVTDKYGDLQVMPLPQPLQARPTQVDMGEGRPKPLPRDFQAPGYVGFDPNQPPLNDEEKQNFINSLKEHPDDWYGVFQDFIKKYGEVPQPILEGLGPESQEILDYAKEDISDFEAGRPFKQRAKKFKPGKAFQRQFQTKKFDPKLMDTYGGMLKRLGQNASEK